MDIGPTSGVLFSFRFNESALENLLFSKEGLEENSCSLDECRIEYDFFLLRARFKELDLKIFSNLSLIAERKFFLLFDTFSSVRILSRQVMS